MKLIVQRVNKARLIFEDKTSTGINKGLLVYLGIHKNDTLKDIEICIKKLVGLRIFENSEGKIDYTVRDLNYEIMIVSNFSIYGSIKKGRRPSFDNSAKAIIAKEMYDKFLLELDKEEIKYVSGRFQTYMLIESINDGPMNLIFDTREGEWYV